MKKLFVLLALVPVHALAGEPKFNALDLDDPLYAEYQRNLCAGTAELRDRFAADVYWLEARNTRLTAATVEDYVISAVLYENQRDRFDANCR